jgi:NADH-ubiquinone oxidoreductase chain 1
VMIWTAIHKCSFYEIFVLCYCLGGNLYSFFFMLGFILFLFYLFGFVVLLPRFRYKLMYLAWRRFLPLSLNYLLFFTGVKCFTFSFFVVH